MADSPALHGSRAHRPIDHGTLVRKASVPAVAAGAKNGGAIEKAALAQAAAAARLQVNAKYLKNANVGAFLKAIATAEGGDYNLKFGGVKGRKHDKWQFDDFTTHPGAGVDGKTTAAGMYQINVATWREMGAKMGLTDFGAGTQDLLAVEILRTIGVIDAIVAGDVDAALSAASRRWAALPKGKDLGNRYPPQKYLPYDEFVEAYEGAGGVVKKAETPPQKSP